MIQSNIGIRFSVSNRWSYSYTLMNISVQKKVLELYFQLLAEKII